MQRLGHCTRVCGRCNAPYSSGHLHLGRATAAGIATVADTVAAAAGMCGPLGVVRWVCCQSGSTKAGHWRQVQQRWGL